jgi:Bacterial SH3 domain
MKFNETIATAALILWFSPAGILAAGSPTPIPRMTTAAAAATATPVAAPTTAGVLKPVNKRFVLTHSSSVYEQPDKTSAVIAHVRRRTHVRVTGVKGDWMRIRLPSGKVGFIPSSAAE